MYEPSSAVIMLLAYIATTSACLSSEHMIGTDTGHCCTACLGMVQHTHACKQSSYADVQGADTWQADNASQSNVAT